MRSTELAGLGRQVEVGKDAPSRSPGIRSCCSAWEANRRVQFEVVEVDGRPVAAVREAHGGANDPGRPRLPPLPARAIMGGW